MSATGRPGCEHCADPLNVALREQEFKRLTPNIALFKCPQCGAVILDDYVGLKGAGAVFHATPEQIEEYLKRLG